LPSLTSRPPTSTLFPPSLHDALPIFFSDGIILPDPAADIAVFPPKQTLGFHRVQNRIERARTDAVAMFPQLLRHPHSVDRMLFRMMQNMNVYETEEKFPDYLIFQYIVYPSSISHFN